MGSIMTKLHEKEQEYTTLKAQLECLENEITQGRRALTKLIAEHSKLITELKANPFHQHYQSHAASHS